MFLKKSIPFTSTLHFALKSVETTLQQSDPMEPKAPEAALNCNLDDFIDNLNDVLLLDLAKVLEQWSESNILSSGRSPTQSLLT